MLIASFPCLGTPASEHTSALDHLGADGEGILRRGALGHVGLLTAEGNRVFIRPRPGGLLG